jgi:hypothetical protein
MSIWTAVMPSTVPATLKSISPSASSRPWMSERTEYAPSLRMSPIAMPPTCFLSGTPASISESVLAHTEPIDDEPLLSNVSETSRSVYGN